MSISPEKEAARESARAAGGTFGRQKLSGPEPAVLAVPSPKAIGMVGGGPYAPNVYAEPADNTEDRPLRPYFALTPGDDDEFFDARQGTRLHVTDGERVRKFVLVTDARFSHPVWDELSEEREVPFQQLTGGDLWAELFNDDGTMKSARYHLPVGMLYSDRRGFVSRDDIDVPLPADDAKAMLAAASRVEMVSASIYGDSRHDGIDEGFDGPLALKVEPDGWLVLGKILDSAPTKRFSLNRNDLFLREGDIVIVIRGREQDPGYGWEETIRITG